MKNRLMLGITLATLAVCAACPVFAVPKLPAKIGYTIYVRGVRAGHNDIQVKYVDDTVVFTSSTELEYEDYILQYRAETIADAKTFRPVKFSWDGTKRGSARNGTLTFSGDKIMLDMTQDGAVVKEPIHTTYPDVLILEDYLIEHEILIANSFAIQNTEEAVYTLVFPSTGTQLTTGLRFSSDLSFESMTRETVCRKLVVNIENSGAFASFYDPERGLPVYIAFPSTFTEVFLDEFFGDQPVVRYRPPSE